MKNKNNNTKKHKIIITKNRTKNNNIMKNKIMKMNGKHNININLIIHIHMDNQNNRTGAINKTMRQNQVKAQQQSSIKIL